MPAATEDAVSILRYWFGDGADEAEIIREQSALWWEKDPRVDAEIRRRFEPALEAEWRGELASWDERPGGRLARILLCDQFPRNMYRGTARAFASDGRARALARVALDSKLDRALRPVERVFVYLPFEHSENAADQSAAVRLFTALHEQAPPDVKAAYRNFLDYALRHKEIIDRFGRFPHRNGVLGRESTPEEREFLAGSGSSF
jgi:uncharacterized protein (DUF924 family)